MIRKKSAVKLFKHFNINFYVMKIESGKQLAYDLIYNIWPVELRTWTIYIETNLVNCFIWPFKSFAKAFIQFFSKLDRIYVEILIIKVLIALLSKIELFNFDQGVAWPFKLYSKIYLVKSGKYILWSNNKKKWWIKNGFQYWIQLFSILSNII